MFRFDLCRLAFGGISSDEINVSPKVTWAPAEIEMWLQYGKRRSKEQRQIDIHSYDVTIFPAESLLNSHSVPARKTSFVMDEDQEKMISSNNYYRFENIKDISLTTENVAVVPNEYFCNEGRSLH